MTAEKQVTVNPSAPDFSPAQPAEVVEDGQSKKPPAKPSPAPPPDVVDDGQLPN